MEVYLYMLTYKYILVSLNWTSLPRLVPDYNFVSISLMDRFLIYNLAILLLIQGLAHRFDLRCYTYMDAACRFFKHAYSNVVLSTYML